MSRPFALSATTSLSDAASRVWDVAVVGAGPAGAMAARQAALAGASVLLVDKASFPRWKVCGCCLNAAALGVLESVGLADLPARLNARPLTKIRLAAAGRFAECALPGGVSLSRERLDAALVEAAVEVGAWFLAETEAAFGAKSQAGQNGHSCEQDSMRVLRLRRREEGADVQARVVLAADGLAGRLLHGEPAIETRVADGARLGAGTVLDDAPAFFEEGVIYMASGWGGYVGLVRLEDGRLDVAAALDREAVRHHGGPGVLAAKVLDDAGFPSAVRLEDSLWRGTPQLTRRPARVAAHRVLAVGDAAGYIEPFTGEGMAWALAGGAAAAPLAVAGAEDWSEDIGRAWEARHRQLIGSRQQACRWVSRLLRRPRLCALAVRVLRAAPRLASPLVKAINQPFPMRNSDCGLRNEGLAMRNSECGMRNAE